MTATGSHGCGRPHHGGYDGMGIGALDPRMLCTLTVARYFFQSFAVPQLEGWTRALSGAEHLLGRDAAPGFACAVLRVVQAMRRSRKSVFHFSNPDCSNCAARLSGHERLLLNALRATLEDRPDNAEGHAMLLCEGNDTSEFLEEVEALARMMEARPHRVLN